MRSKVYEAILMRPEPDNWFRALEIAQLTGKQRASQLGATLYGLADAGLLIRRGKGQGSIVEWKLSKPWKEAMDEYFSYLAYGKKDGE